MKSTIRETKIKQVLADIEWWLSDEQECVRVYGRDYWQRELDGFLDLARRLGIKTD